MRACVCVYIHMCVCMCASTCVCARTCASVWWYMSTEAYFTTPCLISLRQPDFTMTISKPWYSFSLHLPQLWGYRHACDMPCFSFGCCGFDLGFFCILRKQLSHHTISSEPKFFNKNLQFLYKNSTLWVSYYNTLFYLVGIL